ncbi:hypothetical protein OE88DRAFT_1810473 [Heliocybe sulcata]|uniref:Uncharacterized protein n=1 Tax=Heliocybe sulcata TaxID=5364 RepID=A0A5C3MTK3_9AGAM|nr:hypothetical protein OE88DRAFT_1810473 [Heliocybe sulcata]
MLPLPVLQERLQTLGAPRISDEDLERLNKGHFGEAIAFLLEHVVGRDAVRVSRGTLYCLQDGRQESSLRAPSINRSLMDVKKTNANMMGARDNLKELQDSLDKRQKSLSDLEDDMTMLKRRIQDKQAVDLLLSILEKKAAIRTRRLKESAKLLEQLRDDAHYQPTQNRALFTDGVATTSVTPLNVSNTRDALASTKREKLQQLSDMTVALAHLSQQHLANISTFVNVTSKGLRASLDNEAKAVKGHVDVLQWDISARDNDSPADDAFRAELCGLLGLARHTTTEKIMKTVEKLVSEGQRRAVFLERTGLPDPASLRTEEEAVLLSKHKKSEQKMEEQLSKLLTRKVEKAKKADVLVKDVERTARELNTIVSLSR